jgi:hypothetical protein
MGIAQLGRHDRCVRRFDLFGPPAPTPQQISLLLNPILD